MKTASVLIVDDSSVVRERLVEKLSIIKEVEILGVAESTREAMEKFRRLSPSVVVLDLAMPDGNGFKVLEEIKRDHPETLVIMLTNYAFPQHKKRSLNGGADFFLDKSTEFNEVAKIISRHASGRLM